MKAKNLILIVTLFLCCTACKKDENGNRITYYKNKTGEGHVFFKFKNDSIAPIKDAKIGLEYWTAGSGGFFSTALKHVGYVQANSDGKYFFYFLKKINGEKVRTCYIFVEDSPYDFSQPIPTSGSVRIRYGLLDTSNKIFIDTIFYYPDR